MLITIAIPFYNAEKYLLDAIKSVFAQTLQDWELLLIDDGSTDNSLKIAQSIDDPRVRVFSDGLNKRLAGRLNEVSQLAKGKYIARMDADDIMDPQRLDIQCKFLEENNDYDLITCGTFSIMNNYELKGYRGMDYSEPITIEDIIKGRVSILHAGILARKEWYQRNFYDESLPVAQDFDMWLNAINKNDLKIRLIKEPLYIYREEQNVTYTKLKKVFSSGPKIYIKHIKSPYLRIILVIKSKIKLFIIEILNSIGQLHLLHKSRNRKVEISELTQNKYQSILQSVLKQEIIFKK